MLMGLEPALIARLETIPGLLGVYGAGEFAQLAKAGKPAPCAYVLYGGYSVLGSNDDGTMARVEDAWLVVLAVKHAGRDAGAAPTRSLADTLAQAVLGKLLGWQPDAGSYKALRLASAPRPEPTPAHLLFPLAFKVEHVVKSVG